MQLTDLLQNYTGLMVLTCLFLVATMAVVHTNRIVDSRARRAFTLTAIALVLITVTDWFSVIIDGQMPELRALHTLTTALTFSLAPIVPVSLVDAIFPNKRVKLIWAFIFAHIALEVATLFGGFVFWVDEANLYHRGSFYLAYISVYALSGIYLIVQSVRAGRTYQSSNIVAILAIVFCLAAGVLIQLTFSHVHTSWTAVAMAVMLYFAYYCDLTLQTDALTMLLNRRSYENAIAQPELPMVVVSLDLDDFKVANDSFGHRYGDKCLTAVADCIRRVYGPVGRCYRTGGDEFVVLMSKRLDDAELLGREFAREIDAARSRDARVPLVSVGFARADASCTDFPAVVDEADRRMYAEKRSRKAARSQA